MDRTIKIAAEMQRVISEIIRNDLKDPRIPLVTSVAKVKLTKDLKYAKVYISIFGKEEEKKPAMEALNNSAGYVRRTIGKKMIIRELPEITFLLDDTVEQAIKMSAKIDEVLAKSRQNSAKNNGDATENSSDNSENKADEEE